MASRRLRTAIASLLSSSLAFLLLVEVGGCTKPTDPATVANAAPAPAAKSIGKPLTDEECLTAGAAIAKAASAGDGDAAALDRLFDWDAVNQRATDGIEAPDKLRQDFIKGLNQSRATGRGVANAIVDAVKRGGSYTLIRSHTRDERPYLLFRLLLPEAGVNYHDLPIARRADGSVKAVDLYVYLSGEPISQTFRRAYVQSVAQGNGGLLARLSGSDRKFVEFFDKLGKMGVANRNGQFAETLKIYKSLPAELRKEKSVLLIRLQAAQAVGDESEYTQSIEDYRREHPDDPSIDILSIDYYIMKKQFAEAIACVDRLDKAIAGDPYLQTIRANIHVEQGDLDAARQDLKKATEADPNMVDAYWSLINVSLKEKNHEETLRNLRTIHDKFKIEIGDLTTIPPYNDFAKSPQYQEWIKDHPVTAPAPAADPKPATDQPKP